MSGISLTTEVILIAKPILGYIDPGSGSAIISAIIGVVVATGLAIKTYWYKLKRLFTSGKTSVANQPNNPTGKDEDLD
jgi:hypothetical protein